MKIGEASVCMHRGMYRVYIADSDNTANLAPTPNTFNSYEEAKVRQYELNDWQPIGRPGYEVYKGDATFNRAFSAQPYEHVLIFAGKLYFFIWDTREITRVAKYQSIMHDYMHIEKTDNGKALCYKGKRLSLSELKTLPITFKTAKQSANEAYVKGISFAELRAKFGNKAGKTNMNFVQY